MDSKLPYDPMSGFNLGDSGFFSMKNAFSSAVNTPSKQDTPFYIPSKSGKTSAEIIEEAKATMGKSADDNSTRAAVRTVDTKRPFTPRQTDRRLYYGSTNHVARPPSSFRLLPLPEEEIKRPVTGVKITTNSEKEGSKLPSIHPINSPKPSISAQRRSPKDRSKSNYRSSSLTDVVEVSELDLIQVQNDDGPSSTDEIIYAEDPEERIQKSAKKKFSRNNFYDNSISDKPVEPAKVAEDLILPGLLDNLKQPNLSREDILARMKSLYTFIVDSDNPKFFSKRRGEIIKVLGAYVDSENPDVLIHLVQILLSINVRKQNLATAYKLIYKVAREAENDPCFLNSDTLELLINSIGGACPINDSEALVYGYGALKFLTMNSQTREKLKKMGILDLVLLHLKLICESKAERKIPDETSHVLFQLTGVVRNLVNDISMQKKLVAMSGITLICRCLELFITDLDVVCNITRSLSVLSSNDEACIVLTENKSFASTAVKVLQKFPGRQDIVVRLSYCLGNLMAKCDEARPYFGPDKDDDTGIDNMDTLLDLLHSYKKKDVGPKAEISIASKLESEDDHGSSGNAEDVVIKIIRVFANMSINPKVGQQVASMPEVYNHLTDILATRNIIENEELILSTLATLNNLTYYPVDIGSKDTQDSSIYNKIERYIDCANIEAQIESSRVLGNLTRSKNIRDQVAKSDTWNVVLHLLSSDQRDLVYTSVGVIVNMMSDWDKRTNLRWVIFFIIDKFRYFY